MENIRVLLVDDDEDDYLLTRDLLAEAKAVCFALDWANTSEAALERIAGTSYDACLLDYRLGVYDGLQFLQTARGQGFDSPVILLTGHGNLEIDLAAMRAGVVEYLLKDEIDSARLERSLRYAVQQHRMQALQKALQGEQAARAQAEAATRAKDEFLALVVHELRGPLNAISGWVQVLRQSHAGWEDKANVLAALERSVKSQAHLINDLLDTDRMIHGTLSVDARPLAIGSVVDAAVADLRPAAEAKAIEVEAPRDPAVGRVSGDPDRLRQIVENLLGNAIKFTSANGRVEVRLARAGASIELSVSDTGRGISAELLPHVFERYRQDGGMASTRAGGLGLGLALVRHLVELHGGTVRAESSGQGHGATITVTLPLAREDQGDEG